MIGNSHLWLLQQHCVATASPGKIHPSKYLHICFETQPRQYKTQVRMYHNQGVPYTCSCVQPGSLCHKAYMCNVHMPCQKNSNSKTRVCTPGCKNTQVFRLEIIHMSELK